MKGMQSEICLCLLAFTRAISFGSHASTLALAPAMLGEEREFALLRLVADDFEAGDAPVPAPVLVVVAVVLVVVVAVVSATVVFVIEMLLQPSNLPSFVLDL